MAVTLNEVARAAQVSVSTASLAFSGAGPIAAATRDRVLKAAAELGYQGPNPMAASLRRGRTGVIGIVTDDDLRHSFRDPVSVQVLDGIAGALGEAGYGVLLIPRQDPAGKPHPLLRSAAIDAAIMFYAITARDPAIAALRRRKIPMVAMSGNPRGVAMVNVQERRGMRELGDYLRDAGHERIGVATLPYSHARRSGWADLDEAPTYSVTAARLAGIRDAGIEPAAIWECRGSLVDEGIAAGRELLELTPTPTALIGFSDLIAAGMLLAAREAGLEVPGAVAIAGFDGVDLPWLSGERLTTVNQPRRDRGAVAAETALALAGGTSPGNQTLGVELVVGTTT